MIHVVTEQKSQEQNAWLLPSHWRWHCKDLHNEEQMTAAGPLQKSMCSFILGGFPQERTSWVCIGSGELPPSKINAASMPNNGFSLIHSEFVTLALTCSLPGLGRLGMWVPAPAESWWPGKTECHSQFGGSRFLWLCILHGPHLETMMVEFKLWLIPFNAWHCQGYLCVFQAEHLFPTCF